MALAMGLVASALGQTTPDAQPGMRSQPTVQMDYTNPGLTPSHWVLSLATDGHGHFLSERGTAQGNPSQGPEPADVDRDILVNSAFARRAYETARMHGNLAGCESHMKVAFQGAKKLSYAGPDGSGSCTFNYSKDKEIQALGDALVAVANGVVEGARIENLLQHDRLGLDKEIEFVVEAVGDGRIQQIGSIREILERVAGDPQVMDRVRKRARALLAHAES
jgi:hypothetical protein